jgi:hypothetical protein
MEPATLYLMYQLAGDGRDRVLERPFDSAAECETFVTEKVKRATSGRMIRYACVTYRRYEHDVPSWYAEHFTPRVIHGVPLAPDLRP